MGNPSRMPLPMSAPIHYLYSILLPDGHAYIGRSVRPRLRFSEHACADSYVGNAIRHHGPHNCILQILCAGSKDYIADLEQRAILKFNTLAPWGYNAGRPLRWTHRSPRHHQQLDELLVAM